MTPTVTSELQLTGDGVIRPGRKAGARIETMLELNVHAGFAMKPYALLGETPMRISEREKGLF
jgi:hypothetical protein